MNTVRPPAVAGTFYPADAPVLARDIDALLAGVESAARGKPVPKAIIAPHAGYIYSGPVTRVVLLGPVHRVPVRGLALPGAALLATPLGNVAIDADALATLSKLPQITVSPRAHALEHSLEVHLPFLQTVLEKF